MDKDKSLNAELEEILKEYNEQTPEVDNHSHVDYSDSYGDSCCC